MEMIGALVKTESKKRTFRRLLIWASILVVGVIIVLSVVVAATTWSLKDLSVDSSTNNEEGGSASNLLTRFNFGNTHDVVATAAAEDVWEVAATVDAFDELKANGVFRARPRLVIVECVDDSVIQFPPETIQAFPASAKISNSNVGVSLKLA